MPASGRILAAGLALMLATAVGVPAGAAPPFDCSTLPSAEDLPSWLAALFDYDQPAATEARFSALAGQAESCGRSAMASEILAQVARAQGIQGRLDQAGKTLDKAEALAAGPRLLIRLKIERGRLARRAKDEPRARLLFSEAFETARRQGEDALAADAAHMMALLSTGAESALWTDRGLAIAEGSDDPVARNWVGNLSFNAAMRLDESGDHEAAALMLARALAARRAAGDPALVAATELALSLQLAKLGQAEQAMSIQERLLREADPSSEFAAEIRRARDETRERHRRISEQNSKGSR